MDRVMMALWMILTDAEAWRLTFSIASYSWEELTSEECDEPACHVTSVIVTAQIELLTLKTLWALSKEKGLLRPAVIFHMSVSC